MIEKLAKKLKLSNETIKKAKEIAKVLEKVDGITELALASTSLYIASALCGERRTQEEIFRAGGSTPTTIRRYLKIWELMS